MENASGVSTMISSLQTSLADFSLNNLALVFAGALTITVTLVLGWFAYRFITRKTSKAMNKGKL